MAPKTAHSAAQCVRLGVGALHAQCAAWGVPCTPGQLDIELRAALARRIHEEQAHSLKTVSLLVVCDSGARLHKPL